VPCLTHTAHQAKRSIIIRRTGVERTARYGWVGGCHRHRIDKYLDTLLANQTARKASPPSIAKSGSRKMADCPSYYALGSIAGSAPVVGAGAKLNAQRREIKNTPFSIN